MLLVLRTRGECAHRLPRNTRVTPTATRQTPAQRRGLTRSPRKNTAPQRSGHVAQRSYRHHEAYIQKGERTQQGEKSQSHHADSCPHPAHAQGAKNDASNRQGTKILHFSHHFHGPGNAQLPASAGHHDQRKEDRLKQLAVLQALLGLCSGLRGLVCPTTNTPRQMMAMPSQRKGETGSPNMKYPSSADHAIAHRRRRLHEAVIRPGTAPADWPGKR